MGFLRCLHRHGGRAQAGNPCYWACLLKHALRLLTRLYFYFCFKAEMQECMCQAEAVFSYDSISSPS